VTEQKKTIAGGVTLASVVAVLALWPQIEPAATWAMRNLGVILGREQVQAVLASLSIGVLLGVVLPRWLCGDWPPAKTRAVTGIACSLVTFAAALALVPNRIGFVYAILSAVATPTVSAAIRSAWFWMRPEDKPESLLP
jgi:hypothetical protein